MKLIVLQCTCSSVKGPVAVLEAAVLSAPPRLKIYASLLRETDSTRAQPNFGGVPYALMDYLVATSLILVTDIEEWMHRPEEDVEAARTAMEAFLPDSMRNWRKYRSSYVSSSHSHSPSDSILHIPGTNTGWGDDSRSMISDTGTTPSPATSTHPYSFWQMNSSNIPPVPQVPAEHQSALSPLSRSATLGSRHVNFHYHLDNSPRAHPSLGSINRGCLTGPHQRQNHPHQDRQREIRPGCSYG